MKIWTYFILGLVVILLSFGVFRLFKETKMVQSDVNQLTATLKKLEQENKTVNDDIRYFSKDENLLKEAKSQFNFKNPDEKMIIVFPDQSTSTE